FDLTQYEGVMLAGKKLATKVGTVPRFELSSLDVRSAAEAALDRRSSPLAGKDIEWQCRSASPASRPASVARKTFQTAGIVVVDRGRQQQAVAQFATRNEQLTRRDSIIVLDSDDLTIGYRLDVGVPLKGSEPTYAWRTLMSREMRYGITGLHAPRVKALAPLL